MLALDARPARSLWDTRRTKAPVYDARHRRSSFAGPTPVTDGTMVYAYFGPEGLYAYDSTGKLAWKVVEQVRDARSGHRHVAGALRESRHHSARRGQRRHSVDRGLRQEDRQGSLEHEARRCRSAGARRCWCRPAARTELVTNGSENIIAYDPATGKELWRTTGVREQRDPHAARRQRPGDRDRRVSGEESDRHPSGRRARRQARGVGIRERHGLRALEHSLRRLPLSPDRQRHRDVSRSRRRGR